MSLPRLRPLGGIWIVSVCRSLFTRPARAVVLCGLLAMLLPAVSLQAALPKEGDESWVEQVRKEHPRIFFNAQMLPALRELAKGQGREDWEKLKARVDAYPDEPEGSSGGPVITEEVKAGRDTIKVQRIDPAQEWGKEAMECALAWLISGERKYLDKARRMLEVSVEVYRQCDEDLRTVNWYSDSRIMALAAYDWIYNELTPEQRRAIIIPFLDHIDRNQRGVRPLIYRNNTSLHTSGFYGSVVMLWYGGLATYGDGIDDERAQRMLVEGFDHFRKMFEFRGSIAGDDGGMPTTTINYALKTYPAAQFNFLHSWNSAMGENIAGSFPELGLFANWIFWNWIADTENGGPFEFGDGDALHYHNNLPTDWLYDHLTHVLYFYAESDPDAAALAKSLREFSGEETFMGRWPFYPFIMPHRSVAENAQSLDLAALPLRARHFEGLGQVIMRSGFEPDSTFALFSIGAKGRMHRHLDEGHFTIYKNGFLALDSGTRGNSRDYQLRHYYGQSVAHNVILIHQPGEKTPVYWGRKSPDPEGEISHGGMHGISGETLAFETNETYSYVAGNTTAAYQDKAKEVVRQFVHVQPDYFIVYDRVVSTEPSYRKEWLLHTQNEPLIDGNSFRADEGNGRLFGLTLLPTDAVVQKVGGPGKEYWASGRNWELNTGALQEIARAEANTGRKAPLGQWRMEVTTRGEQQSVRFLNLLQAASQDVDKMIRSELIRTVNMDGVRLYLPASAPGGEGVLTVLFNREGKVGGSVRLEREGRVIFERPLAAEVTEQSGVIF